MPDLTAQARTPHPSDAAATSRHVVERDCLVPDAGVRDPTEVLCSHSDQVVCSLRTSGPIDPA
jgi:hypothetical protein